MRTTLNIDDLLMKQLLEATHEKSKTRAIAIAIKDYLKKKRIKKILSYHGTVDIENNWQQLEKEEIMEYLDKSRNASQITSVTGKRQFHGLTSPSLVAQRNISIRYLPLTITFMLSRIQTIFRFSHIKPSGIADN